MAESEVAPGKRQCDEDVAPDAKRAKLEENISLVQSAISSTELKMSWSDSFRELLQAVAPSALEMQLSDRTAKEEVLLRVISEIFGVEEERLITVVEANKAKGELSSSKRSKAEEQVDVAQKSLTEAMAEATEAWKPLKSDANEVRSAEAKFLKDMVEVVAKQKEMVADMKQHCFEPLKTGSWTEESDCNKRLAAVMPLFKQVSDKPVLASCVGVLTRKPEDRGGFDSKILEQLERDLDKYLAAVSEQESRITSDVAALHAGEESEEITFERAEQMLQQHKQAELGNEKAKAVQAKEHSLQTLKEGAEIAPAQRKKLIAELKRACRKIADQKTLFPKAVLAFDKDVQDRTESDADYIRRLEDALGKYISSLEEKLQNQESVDAGGKKEDVDMSGVTALLEGEEKERREKQKEATKDRNALLELKTSTYEPLKNGTWEGADVPKPMVRGLNKLLKVIEIDSSQVKTLTAVIKKKPADRESFDEVLVQQIELSLNKRVDSLDQKLAVADTTEKYAALRQVAETASAAQEALEEAREKQLSNLQEAMSLDAKRKTMETRIQDRQEFVKQMMEEEKQALDLLAQSETSLENFKRARDVLGWFRGEEVKRNEPTPSEEVACEKVETPQAEGEDAD